MKRMSSENLLVLRDALRVMILRELRALDREIAAYPDDESVWSTPPGISNSAGTLVLHLAGNLRHFIGSVFGKTGYVRNREAEFATRDLSRERLRAEVQQTIAELDLILDRLGEDQLVGPFLFGERQVRTADSLVHLAVHLGYHLGQIDYHRRLLTQNPQPADAMSVRELPGYEETR